MPATKFTATSATGSSPCIAAALLRDEVIIQHDRETARVWFALNEPAVVGTGLWLDYGGCLVLTGKKANSAIYAVTEVGETAKLGVQLD